MKRWGTKRDLDRFYVNTVLQDQTSLELRFDSTMIKKGGFQSYGKKIVNDKIRPTAEIQNDPFLKYSLIENRWK